MNDAERPRRAALPDDNSDTPIRPGLGADDVERTVVRDEPFALGADTVRARAAHQPTPGRGAVPPPSASDAWFRDGTTNGSPAAGPPVAAPATTDHRRLRGSLLLTLASAILPGAGLLGAPQKRLRALGAVTSLLTIAAVSVVGWLAVTDLGRLARFAGNESVLGAATLALIALALAWVTLITVTALATRPSGLHSGRRLLSALVVTALAFGVAAPTAVAARYSRDTTLALKTILKGSEDVKANNQPTIAPGVDPWANQKRVNILLLGADGNAARAEQVAKYSIRTDTIMVASIDTVTGDTTLIQIPRNVQHTPFPEGSEMAEAFPDGFRGEGSEGDWYINSIWQHVELDYPDLMAGSTYRGADALKEGVEGITGLEINQFVLLNIDGLQQLIDAMGGVTVNINEELAVGGDTAKGTKPKRYLQPGPNQHLGGYDAMWYARSRYNTNDYNRMERQSCLVDAIVDQANPQTLLTNFEPIVKASADMLATDITDNQLSAYIDLAFRVKDKGTINRLVFSNGNNGYSYEDPDFEKMREAVAEAIAPTPSAAPTTKATAAAPTAAASSPTPSAKATPTGKASAPSPEGVSNVADACAWQGEG